MKNGYAATNIKYSNENRKQDSAVLFGNHKYKFTFLLKAIDRLVPELGRCEFLVSCVLQPPNFSTSCTILSNSARV